MRRGSVGPPTLGLPDTRGRRGLVAAILIDSVGSGLFLPFAVLYPTLVAGIPLGVTGGILSLATLLALPIPLLTGLAVDRLGPRLPVVVASLLQGAGFAGYLAMTRPWHLFACAFCVAAGNQAYWAANGTFLAAVSAPEERSRWFALQGACRSAGIGAGAALAGLVASAAASVQGYHLLAALNALSFVLAGWLSARVPLAHASPAGATPESPQREALRGGYRTVLRDWPFLGFTATNVAFSLCVLSFSLVLPAYVVTALRQPAWVAGAIFTLNTVLVATTQTLVTARIRALRRTRALAGAACLFALAFALLALLPQATEQTGGTTRWVTAGLFAAVVMYTAAELMMAPLKNSLVADAAPERMRGRYMAFYHLSWSFASTAAPALLTALLARGRLALWLLLAGVAMLAALALARLDTLLPAHTILPEASRGAIRIPVASFQAGQEPVDADE